MSRMRIGAIALAALLFSIVPDDARANVYTTVNLSNSSGTNLSSNATAYSTDFWGNNNPEPLTGWHRIVDASGGYCANNSWTDNASPWSGSVFCSGSYGSCFRGRVYARTMVTVLRESETGSPQICFGGGGGCGCDLEQDPPPGCPLVLNPGRGPWRLSGADVTFDLDADGDRDPMGWTAAGSSLAFLVTDVNGNGEIDDGSELFGIGTILPNGERAADGFLALGQHDGNGDHVINAADAIWSSLLLWTDANHDAMSQPGELTHISSEYTALELDYRVVGKKDAHGNALRFQAHARRGRTRLPFYDIFFVWP
jgi:hypothetical protein